MEQWKIITTHPNYEISNLGRVRNIQTNEFKNTKPDKNGYIKVNLYPGPKVFFVHRLVAEYFIPKVEGKTLVNHIDSVRTNNFVANLEWCNHKENAQHMVRQGNNPDKNGVKNPRAKFTEEDILNIRDSNETVAVLSKKYGTAETTITNIKNGTRYRNVGGYIRNKYERTNQARGDKIASAKVTEEIAIAIKYDTEKLSIKQFADKYNVSWSIVERIRNNKTWKHI